MRILIIIFSCILFCCCKQDKRDMTSNLSIQRQDSILQNISENNQSTNTHKKTSLELYLDSLGLTNIKEECPEILIDLKYATQDNFTGKILYKNLNLAYLHPFAFEKLVEANKSLKKQNPQLSLLIYDAARPLSIQEEMYNAVKDTKFRAYVADPARTSLHNYGLAVDLTICNSIGNPLDMGVSFDYFGKLAGILNEELFVQQKLLTKEQVENRKLLRSIMTEAGFTPIRGEWWHFNATSLNNAGKIAILIK